MMHVGWRLPSRGQVRVRRRLHGASGPLVNRAGVSRWTAARRGWKNLLLAGGVSQALQQTRCCTLRRSRLFHIGVPNAVASLAHGASRSLVSLCVWCGCVLPAAARSLSLVNEVAVLPDQPRCLLCAPPLPGRMLMHRDNMHIDVRPLKYLSDW